jgi:hypothetical protein
MKKKTMLLSIALLGGVILMLSSCGKYEDGPGLSLRSKVGRVAGDWEVTEFWYNNENALDGSYSDYITCIDGFTVSYTSNTNVNYSISFERNGDWDSEISSVGQQLDWLASYENCFPFYTNVNDSETDKGSWEFDSDKEDLVMTSDINNYKQTWEIIELRENQMKLEMLDAGDKYQMTLKKK